jgi:hypothetical protein
MDICKVEKGSIMIFLLILISLSIILGGVSVYLRKVGKSSKWRIAGCHIKATTTSRARSNAREIAARFSGDSR